MKITDEPVGTFSSELRSPLNLILSLAEILDEGIHGPLNDQQHQSLRRIIEESQRLLSQVDEFTNLIRIESGELQPQPSTVWLSDLAQVSMRISREQAYKKGITIKLDYDNQVEAMVTDEWMLKYTLVNLVVNHVKMASEGGKVTLRVKGNRGENTVCISIEDDGSAISAAQSLETEAEKGASLSLYLAQRMVEMQGGTYASLTRDEGGGGLVITLPWNQPSR